MANNTFSSRASFQRDRGTVTSLILPEGLSTPPPPSLFPQEGKREKGNGEERMWVGYGGAKEGAETLNWIGPAYCRSKVDDRLAMPV